jgi:hypothetical protein
MGHRLRFPFVEDAGELEVEEKRDSSIGELFRRWFKAKESDESDAARPVGPAKVVDISSSLLRSTSPGELGKAALSSLPKPRAVSAKIAALKKAIEFQQALKTRLNQVNSSHDLLLYSYEVLLDKFMALQEMGMLSPESSLVLDSLHQKFETILVKSEPPEPEIDTPRIDKLREENQELQAQLAQMRARLANGGFVSEKELQLEEEAKFLQRRMRELRVELETAGKKVETQSLTAEMVRSLRARNSLLNVRLEHQGKLLQSLTANKPEQEELITKIQEIALENRRLKEQLTEQAGWLEKMQQRFAGDAASQQAINSLINNNSSLQDELDAREERLEGLTARGTTPRFAETIERLSDENFRLNAVLETKQAIKDYLESPQRGKIDPLQIIEMLKLEKRRLQETVTAQKEQVKVVATKNPVSGPMMKTVVRLRDENQQLRKENTYKDRVYRDLKLEKDQLQVELRKVDLLVDQNQKLKGKLDHALQVLQVLKKSEAQLQLVKKEYAILRSKFEAADAESRHAKTRLTKVMGEYDMLMREYENLFGQLDH